MFFRPNFKKSCAVLQNFINFHTTIGEGGHSGKQGVNGRIILKILSGVGCENVNWVEQP
jgi:hypothetical protein